MANLMKPRSRRLSAVLLLLVGLAFTGVQPAVAQKPSPQPGADLAAGISAKKNVKLGENITYTVTATNVGDMTATGVLVGGWVPDWFNFVSRDCLSGVPAEYVYGCAFGDVAPGASVSMTITVEACCPEPHMFELGSVSATNDVNPENDTAEIKVVFTGKGR